MGFPGHGLVQETLAYLQWFTTEFTHLPQPFPCVRRVDPTKQVHIDRRHALSRHVTLETLDVTGAGQEARHAVKAIALMLAASMIKRAVLDLGDGKLLVCFNPQAYSAVLTRN